MRKLLTVAALAALNSACALTNYPVITDQDQVRQANGTHIVNTTGRAFVMQGKGQVASFVGDTSYNTVWFANQDQKGNQTLWTHMNIGVVGRPDTYFHGTTYMNDDRNTCWNVRANNPVVGDVPFDFEINLNCKGSETIALLLSKSARTREAGSDGNNGNDDSPGSDFGGRGQSMAGVTLQQAINVLGQLDSHATFGNYPEYGLNGYKLTVSPSNTDISLATSSGAATDFNLDGASIVYDVVNERAVFDPRAGNTAAILRQLADWVDANGRSGTISVTFAGTTATNPVALFSAEHYRKLADRL